MENMRKYLAKNPKTPQNVLDKLATDGDEEIRKLVAENPNTSMETLAMLANITL